MGIITSKEREANFRADLKTVLENHGAELSATDYGECEIFMNGLWDNDGNITRPSAYFRI